MADSPNNPFVGPRSIELGEALYGRDAEVEELFDLLLSRRIVLLHAPSGAGKSSLVAAGLIPKLRRDTRFKVRKTIRVNLDPSGLEGVPRETNRYLLSAMISLEEEIPEERRRSPAQLACNLQPNDIAAYFRADGPTVLIFDQFEEILTTAPHAGAQKQAFFDAVGEVLDGGTVWALFIIREDYLGALAQYREKLPTQLSNTLRIDLLGKAEAREAAVKLAEGHGRSFPGADRLIEELSTISVQQLDGTFRRESGPYVEPVLLQVVCRRLWEAMPEKDDTIDAADIEQYGKVSEALGDYYAASVAKVSAGDLGIERKLREWVGCQLIVAGARSLVRLGAGRTEGLDNPLIDRLKESYLVRADTRAGVTWFELSHDRLIEAVMQNNQAWELEHLHPMQVQAKLWEQSRRSSALLLGAGALAGTEQWAKENEATLTGVEREFLESSARTRKAEAEARWRDQVFKRVLGVLLVLAIASAGWAWWKTRVAEAEAYRARVATAMAAARELLASNQPTTGALVLSALRDHTTEEWREVMVNLIGKSGQTEAVFSGEPFDFAPAWSPDGTRIVAESSGFAVRVLYSDGSNMGKPLVLADHAGRVLAAAWSPDGTRIVTASADGTARVWYSDGSDKDKPVVLEGHTGPVRSAAWSQDGMRIVTASDDGTARTWQLNGKEDGRMEHQAGVASAMWTPDRKSIVTLQSAGTVSLWREDEKEWRLVRGCVDLPTQIKFVKPNPEFTKIITVGEYGLALAWDWKGTGWEGYHCPYSNENYKEISTGGMVLSAQWSPDGEQFVTASSDGMVRVWRFSKESELVEQAKWSLNEAGRTVLSENDKHDIAWSPDGKLIVVASSDGTARVWNPDGTVVAILRGHTSAVTSAVFSPDGARIATASKDGTTRVWRIAGATEPEWSGEAPMARGAWSPDGKRIIVLPSSSRSGPTHEARVWRVDGSEKERVVNIAGNLSAPWSPDGERILIVSEDQTVIVRRLDATDEDIVLTKHGSPVSCPVWSPDGTRIVAVSDQAAWVWRSDGSDRDLPAILAGNVSRVRCPAWSPDGTRIVTTSADGTARVWRSDGSDKENPVVLAGHSRPPFTAWSPDGELIVTTSERDDTSWIWRSDGTEKAIPLKNQEGYSATGPVVWAPDGKMFISALDDARLQVWRRDGTEAASIKGLRPEWSPNGEWFAAWQVDKVQVWRSDGTPHAAMEGTNIWRRSSLWSPDSRLIVAPSEDNVARVWRPDGTVEAVLRGHADEVTSAAWSPDGTRILTTSEDGTARIWFTPDTLLSLVPPLCLSPKQRERYLAEEWEEACNNYRKCKQDYHRDLREDACEKAAPI